MYGSIFLGPNIQALEGHCTYVPRGPGYFLDDDRMQHQQYGASFAHIQNEKLMVCDRFHQKI